MTTSDAPSTATAVSAPRGSTRVMLIGAIVSAAGALAFQLIGVQVLGEVEFAPIALLWTMQFLGFTILYTPIEQLIVRRLTLSGRNAEALRSARVAIAATIGLGMALPTAFVAINLDRSFDGHAVFAIVTPLLFLSLSVFAIARGMLAGHLRFRDYGLAVGLEAVSRIVLAVAVLLVASSSESLAWALVFAPLAVLALRPFRAGPVAPPEAAAIDTSSAHGFLSGMVITTSASQTILAAGPLVVDALGAGPGAVTTFFVTFTLFRGPLTASYNVLSRVLPWFTAASARGDDPRLRRWSVLLGLGAGAGALVAAGAAAALGPALVELLFDARPSVGLAALAAAGVILGAFALFLGQVLVGRGTTGVLAAVWLVALAVAAVVLGVLVDISPSMRTGWAFVAGEAAALVGTIAVVARPRS